MEVILSGIAVLVRDAPKNTMTMVALPIVAKVSSALLLVHTRAIQKFSFTLESYIEFRSASIDTESPYLWQ